MSLFASAALVLLLLGTAALTLVRAWWPLTAPAPAPGARRLDPAVRWRLAGIVAGAAAAAFAMRTPELGRGILLAAPVFGIGVFAGALTGELTREPPTGRVRRARLRVRRTLDYVPRVLGAGVAASTVLLFGVAIVTTTVGAPDPEGRAGRGLACPGAFHAPWPGAFHAPWPGAYYTLPALAAVVAGLTLAAFTLRRVARRPPAAEPDTADDALRRRSAEVVTAATGVLTLVPLCGITLSAGLLLRTGSGGCTSAWWDPTGQALSSVGFLAFAAAAWCGACVLLPAKRARA